MVKVVLSAVKFDQAAGNEQQYLMALWQLGRQIDWSQLGLATGNIRGLGDRNVL